MKLTPKKQPLSSLELRNILQEIEQNIDITSH